jgi:hypothetical protein
MDESVNNNECECSVPNHRDVRRILETILGESDDYFMEKFCIRVSDARDRGPLIPLGAALLASQLYYDTCEQLGLPTCTFVGTMEEDVYRTAVLWDSYKKRDKTIKRDTKWTIGKAYDAAAPRDAERSAERGPEQAILNRKIAKVQAWYMDPWVNETHVCDMPDYYQVRTMLWKTLDATHNYFTEKFLNRLWDVREREPSKPIVLASLASQLYYKTCIGLGHLSFIFVGSRTEMIYRTIMLLDAYKKRKTTKKDDDDDNECRR